MKTSLKTRVIQGLTVVILLACVTVAALALATGAKASPDPHIPFPPVWCPAGGIQTPFGGYCDGLPYADGTKWHSANGMGFWQPAQCVMADAPAPPPPAPVGGCDQ